LLLVILASFFGGLYLLPRALHSLETLFGSRIVRITIRMILASQLSEGSFNLCMRGIFGNPKCAIGVRHRPSIEGTDFKLRQEP
jgi:hypothetical protein